MWWGPGLLTLLVGIGLTWFLSGRGAAVARADDGQRLRRAAGIREQRMRDHLGLVGADLKRLAAVMAWAPAEREALESEHRQMLREEALKGVLHWGVLECRVKSGEGSGRLEPVRRLFRVSRLRTPDSVAPTSGDTLDEYGDDEHRRAIAHLRPRNELALAAWVEAPGGPQFRLFVRVPDGIRSGREPRVLFAELSVAAVHEALFPSTTPDRLVDLALYRGNGSRPVRASGETPLLHGVRPPPGVQPDHQFITEIPLFGLSLFWETHTRAGFDQVGRSGRLDVLRWTGAILSVLIASIVGLQARSRARHAWNEARLESANTALGEEQATRQWLTRNLHDGILQDLHAASLLAPVGPAGSALRRQLQESMEELRTFLRQTEGRLPSGANLAELVAGLATRLARRCGWTLELDLPGALPGRMAEAGQFELWLAAREILSNAARHAGASKVRVQLHADGGRMILRISDDGRGFDASGAAAGDGFGLANLERRAQAVGGRFDLRSAPGQGTTAEWSVPLDPGGAVGAG